MNSHLTRHRQALKRLVLLALLVVMPVIVVSSHLAAVFGPLHVHDAAQVASEPGTLWPGLGSSTSHGRAHAHAHGGLERHWHLSGDSSVVVIGIGDSGRAADANAQPRTKTFLPLAPPVSASFRMGFDARQAWPDLAPARWVSQSPLPAERPPQA
jgi:hypothetical protein